MKHLILFIYSYQMQRTYPSKLLSTPLKCFTKMYDVVNIELKITFICIALHQGHYKHLSPLQLIDSQETPFCLNKVVLRVYLVMSPHSFQDLNFTFLL